MQPKNWDFRSIDEEVLETVHALNQRYQYLLSSLTMKEFRTILSHCFYHRYLEKGMAFAAAMDDQAEHDGENYGWFKERYQSFVYVDRIVIDKSLQRRGMANAFYENIEHETRKAGRAYLCAEVNLLPPNQASLDFHDARGFERVGTSNSEQKIVQYFAKPV